MHATLAWDYETKTHKQKLRPYPLSAIYEVFCPHFSLTEISQKGKLSAKNS